MNSVTPFPRHRLYRCDRDAKDRTACAEGRCPVCDGGLAICPTCRGAEGDLPTECPQEPMHEDTRAAVANGHLDFVGGRWVCVSVESRRPV